MLHPPTTEQGPASGPRRARGAGQAGQAYLAQAGMNLVTSAIA